MEVRQARTSSIRKPPPVKRAIPRRMVATTVPLPTLRQFRMAATILTAIQAVLVTPTVLAHPTKPKHLSIAQFARNATQTYWLGLLQFRAAWQPLVPPIPPTLQVTESDCALGFKLLP